MNTAGWLLILLALGAANLPFLNQKLFAFLSISSFLPPNTKPLWLRLLELVVLYFLLGMFAWFLEQQRGNVHAQNWEFYAITFCLFLVMAYPGFVWRYLRRKSI